MEEQGKNHLGRILENIRFDIKKNLDMERWLYFTFSLIEKKEFIPEIRIQVKKNKELVRTISLRGKPYYTFGQLPMNDVQMAHLSISRTHAAMIIDAEAGVCLVDLGSKAGTKVNGELIELQEPVPVLSEYIVEFGFSTRSYHLSIDFSQVQHQFREKERKLQKENCLLEVYKQDPTLNKNIIMAALGIQNHRKVFIGNLPLHTR